MNDIKQFQIYETLTKERFVITKTNDTFVWFLYEDGLTGICQPHQILEKHIASYPNLISAITSKDFHLK